MLGSHNFRVSCTACTQCVVCVFRTEISDSRVLTLFGLGQVPKALLASLDDKKAYILEVSGTDKNNFNFTMFCIHFILKTTIIVYR